MTKTITAKRLGFCGACECVITTADDVRIVVTVEERMFFHAAYAGCQAALAHEEHALDRFGYGFLAY